MELPWMGVPSSAPSRASSGGRRDGWKLAGRVLALGSPASLPTSLRWVFAARCVARSAPPAPGLGVLFYDSHDAGASWPCRGDKTRYISSTR